MDELIRRIETSLLELSSEVFVLRNQVVKAQDHNQRLALELESLRKVLDEKRVVSAEEVEITQVLDDVDDEELFTSLISEEVPDKKYPH
jgi:regulator of replication initiation timing